METSISKQHTAAHEVIANCVPFAGSPAVANEEGVAHRYHASARKPTVALTAAFVTMFSIPLAMYDTGDPPVSVPTCTTSCDEDFALLSPSPIRSRLPVDRVQKIVTACEMPGIVMSNGVVGVER